MYDADKAALLSHSRLHDVHASVKTNQVFIRLSVFSLPQCNLQNNKRFQRVFTKYETKNAVNYFGRRFEFVTAERKQEGHAPAEELVAAAQHVAPTACDRQIKEITTNRGSFVVQC